MADKDRLQAAGDYDLGDVLIAGSSGANCAGGSAGVGGRFGCYLVL